jgi:RecJ-like exonuclease
MGRRPCESCGGYGQLNGGRGWNGCGSCHGAGATPGSGQETCPVCHGSGWNPFPKGCLNCGDGGEFGGKKGTGLIIPCPTCAYSTWGTGKVNCQPCGGTGWLSY